MPHNINLPTHRYVYVMSRFVRPQDEGSPTDDYLSAVWWGVSVTPNRTLGAHVVLESGAMVVDLPFHALRWHDQPGHAPSPSGDAMLATWDCYGWDAEIVQHDYLDNMRVTLLDERHQETGEQGRLWFAVDHLRDGFGREPTQHKHLWVVALPCGRFAWVPQDQLLLHDKSFTAVDGVPRIRRQDRVWSVE